VVSGGGQTAGPAAAIAAPRRDALGYVIVLVSYLAMAGAGPLVAWSEAPEAVILVLRTSFAALVLGAIFLRGPMIADWRRPGAAWRLLVMTALSSLTLLLFFYAVRHTNVAIAMFLLFLMPVWIALLAPRLFHAPRAPIVWPALILALAGLAVILVPDVLGTGVSLSLVGLLAALLSGFGYAAYAISVKGLTKIVSSTTISTAEAAGDAVLVLPLALWQLSSSGYHLDGRAWIAAAVLGVVCTALADTLWIEGTRRVPVEQVAILGYVEPVAAPFFAVLLVGQLPTVWTAIGGALILGAGLLVVVFGGGEGEASIAAASEAEPL
jgi:drug/metabolite transporter (DMT)-like permease